MNAGAWRRWRIWLAMGLLVAGVIGGQAYIHAWRTAAAARTAAADLTFHGDPAIVRVANVHFGPDAAQRLEMFLPSQRPAGSPRLLPIVVFIHGGGWSKGDPRECRFVARSLAPRGYAVVLPGYRLLPKARYPMMLQDGAAALRWVADNAARLGGDPDRIVLMGHSAGAYNAVMLALDPRWLAAQGLGTGSIRGVVGLSGLYDFYPFAHPYISPWITTLFGHPDDPRDTQPVAHVRADAPPMLLIHGTADISVSPRNSVMLADAARMAGAPARAVLIKGMDHVRVVQALWRPGDPDHRVLNQIVPFLAQTTSHASPRVQPSGR